MFCQNCGEKANEGDKFCGICGVSLKGEKIVKDDGMTIFSTRKLIILSILSFGIYEIYWFYRQWKILKEKNGLRVTPWARALFSPLYAWSLFENIYEKVGKNTKQDLRNARLLGVSYFLATILYKLPDPYWFLSFSTVIPLFIVQKGINTEWKKTNVEEKISNSFTGKEIFILVFGGILIFFALIGAFPQ